MSVSSPDQKRYKIQELVINHQKWTKCKIREWAQFIEILFATSSDIYLYIASGNYETKLYLWKEVHIDHDRWIWKLLKVMNPIRCETYYLTIFANASLTRWGVLCNEIGSHECSSEEENINILII